MISIAIPTYESDGRGAEFIEFQFKKFLQQTYKDFEVVISDHSQDDEIEKACLDFKDRLEIKYLRNEKARGKSASNVNNAMRHCKGEIIKIIFQDDFLRDEFSLEKIYKSFGAETKWLITSCEHSADGEIFYRRFTPRYHDKIHLGENTVSSPSVLSIRNDEDKIFFDDNLIWLMDVEYYKRLYNKWGPPTVLDEVGVVNRMWGSQLSAKMPQRTKDDELLYVMGVHGV